MGPLGYGSDANATQIYYNKTFRSSVSRLGIISNSLKDGFDF